MDTYYVDTPDFEVVTEANNPNPWDVRIRKSAFGVVPYGYDIDPDNNKILRPNEGLILLIEEALDRLDSGESLRETAYWISEKSGRSISHVGLSKIWKRLRGDNDSVRAARLEAIVEARQPKNKKEKKRKTLAIKQGAEKRRITAAQKRLKALQEKIASEQADLPVVVPYIVMEDFVETEEQKVAFRPNPGPQTEFLAAPEKQVLYGGSAGGGKSYALLADFLRFVHNKNHNGVLLRRTNDELRDLKWKAKSMYKQVFPDANYSEQSSTWTFPSGARLWLTYQDNDDDLLRFQGQEYTWVGFDELTQYPTPKPWNYLLSRLRSDDPELDANLYMRATTNPGGPGHGWVKKMFIDPAPKNEAFWATDIDTGKILCKPDFFPSGHPLAGQRNPNAGEPLFERRFIPSSVFDNPYLANTSYVEGLMSLPEDERRKLLEGDWTVAEGAAFPEFREHVHVCEPFDIPTDWRRFRSCDYGYSSYSAVHWFAIDPAFNTLYVYRELYVSKHTGPDLAAAVFAAEGGERISYGMLDSSCWHQRGYTGPSIAEEMIARGCRWRQADRGPQSRINGRVRLHELLKWEDLDGTIITGIKFFNTCRQIISDLPMIPTDPDGGEDIDDRYASDHAYDSIRYGIMSRPKAHSLFDDFETVNRWAPADKAFGY